MNQFDFYISIAISGAGLLAIYFLASPLISPFLSVSRGIAFKIRLSAARKNILAIDSKIENGKFLEALSFVRESFIVKSSPAPSESSIFALKEHQQNALSRAFILAEELGNNSVKIARIEHLLIEQAELQNLFQKATAAYNRLKNKRQIAKKETPDWTQEEYQERQKKISAELQRNCTELEKEIDKLISQLSHDNKSQVVYH